MTDTKSEPHKNVHVALCAAQLEFGLVAKGATNPAFKSKYADLSDVAGVVIPTLARHGVAVLHYLVRDDLSAMRTEFVHGETGTSVCCDVPLIVDRQNMQGMKSATTYAKRIGLESLSGVAPDDDDGNAAATNPPARQQRQAPRNDGPSPAAIAAESLGNAETLEALKAIWSDLGALQKYPAVIRAKDTRKDELDRPADSADADEIPH